MLTTTPFADSGVLPSCPGGGGGGLQSQAAASLCHGAFGNTFVLHVYAALNTAGGFVVGFTYHGDMLSASPHNRPWCLG